MKERLINKFKNGKLAVNVETQAEWFEFMEWLEENTDLKWMDTNNEPTKFNSWKVYEKDICVTSKISYSSASYYREEGYEIIKYKDLKERKGMKTTEFIKRAQDLGYSVEQKGGSLYVRHSIRGTQATLDTKELNCLETWESIPDELFDLIVEYAKTPIEEREEEKKFRIYPKGMEMYDENSLEYNHDEKVWGDSETMGNTFVETQYAFTLKELEDLGINPEHYDLEEVE